MVVKNHIAILRNLRNILASGVSPAHINKIKKGLTDESWINSKVLPFRFIAAAKYAPQIESEIEVAMFKCLEGKPKLSGKTALVVDGSGSMFGTPISKKSEIDRFEAASALAILAREICESCVIVVFSQDAFIVPDRRGFALRDALRANAQAGGTNTQNGIMRASQEGYDRIIVLTDEQSHQSISNPLPNTMGYVVNVATYRNGIGYGAFNHIDGWSDSVLDYIAAIEFINKE